MDEDKKAPSYHLNFSEYVPVDARKYINDQCTALRKEYDAYPERRKALSLLHDALRELSKNPLFNKAWLNKPSSKTASSYYKIFYEYLYFSPTNNKGKTKLNTSKCVEHLKEILAILEKCNSTSLIADICLYETITENKIFPFEVDGQNQVVLGSGKEFLSILAKSIQKNKFDSHRYSPAVKAGKAAKRHFYALKFAYWVQYHFGKIDYIKTAEILNLIRPDLGTFSSSFISKAVNSSHTKEDFQLQID